MHQSMFYLKHACKSYKDSKFLSVNAPKLTGALCYGGGLDAHNHYLFIVQDLKVLVLGGPWTECWFSTIHLMWPFTNEY